MKVLVTGSNGYAGSAVVRRLLERGERDIRCLVRPGGKWGHLEAMRKDFPDAKLEIFEGNLLTPGVVDGAMDGVGVVYHLAIMMQGAPTDMFMSTVVASQKLIDAIARQKQKVRVVLMSSFSAFGIASLQDGATINEETPIEDNPKLRDVYSYAKVWQEKLFWEKKKEVGFELVVVRPGVIYGNGSGAPAAKIGMDLFGFFVDLGGNNPLPLSYVENCADATVLVGQKAPDGEVYGLWDDDLPTCSEYLDRYKREVRPLRTLRIPYPIMIQLSKVITWYVDHSQGQLPPAFTPYKVKAMWRPVRLDNSKIKALGWKQPVSTEEAMARTFQSLRAKA